MKTYLYLPFGGRFAKIMVLTAAVLTICSACRGLYMQYVEPMEIMGFEDIIYDDTTWSKDDSPVQIRKNIFIIPDATLTIEPGVKVLLGPDAVIKSFGRIVADGTPDEPIVITRLTDACWDRFDCFGGRLEADGSLPVNLFRHCTIEGGRGITVRAGAIRMESCILRHNVSTPIRLEYTSGIIRNNHIYANTTMRDTASGNGAGIMVYTDKQVTVSDNEVYDNVSSGGRDGGGGIYAYAYDTGSVSILRNRIHGNRSDRHGGGLVAYSCRVEDNVILNNRSRDSGGGVHAIRSIIAHNTIRDNRSNRGGGLYAEDSGINTNTIVNNSAPGNLGGGMYYYGEGRITGNLFEGNGPGDTIVVSGNPVIRRNNIVALKGQALRVGTHSLASDLDARENYWGTARRQLIPFLVYDWLDDSDIGLVNWGGFLPVPIPDAPRPSSAPTASGDQKIAHQAASVLQGVLDSDRVLGKTGGAIYQVKGNILVPEGVAITILPATVFEIAPNVTFRVRGTLQAKGLSDHPIRFTGDAEQPWGRIFFDKQGLTQAPDDPAELKNGSGVLKHCIIEHGSGILMEGMGPVIDQCVIQHNKGSGISIRNAPAKVTNCSITANSSPTNGGGIYTYGSKLVFLSGNRILGNYAKEDGGGVFAYGYRSNTAANLMGNRIEGNACGGDGGGVWASRSSLSANRVVNNKAGGNGGGIYITFALAEENTIEGNRAFQGGGVYAETNSTLAYNQIESNHAEASVGGGVYLNFWGMSIKNEVFEGNRVTGNRTASPDGNGGVYLNGAMRFDKNSIFRNSGYQLYNGNPPDQGRFKATGCYWGTKNEIEISDLIYDGLDDRGLSTVVFKPFALVEIKK